MSAASTSPTGALPAPSASGGRTRSTPATEARAYYNEFDRFAAQWLRNLIAAGHIAPGDVDERSISDVQSSDLAGYTQCHFFAGIGGWSLALRMAGWPDDEPVWSGSCPCQPLSCAGQRKGHADERHLWPAFHRLIAECAPATVFGEQVASKDGREWLAGIRADLEALGYACGAADLCAAGVGAPHIRQRLWWVADANQERHKRAGRAVKGGRAEPAHQRDAGVVGDAQGERREGRQLVAGQAERREPVGAGAWSDLAWLPCRDGKARPTQPGLQPLAHGIPGRVGRLRAYGNAIVPQVAAEFVTAFLECAP